MKVRELIFKDMGKNLIRTILDNHRDAALYKAAANQFLDMICYEKSPYYNTGVELIDKLNRFSQKRKSVFKTRKRALNQTCKSIKLHDK